MGNTPVAIPVGESRGVSEEDKSFLKDFFVDFIQNYAGPKTRANLATGIVCFAAAAGCWSWLGSSSVLGLTGTVGFAALGLRNSYQGLLGNYSAKSMDNYRKKIQTYMKVVASLESSATCRRKNVINYYLKPELKLQKILLLGKK